MVQLHYNVGTSYTINLHAKTAILHNSQPPSNKTNFIMKNVKNSAAVFL